MAPPAHRDGDDGVARVAVGPLNVEASVAHEAAAATEREHNMGLMESLRLYRKACGWSVFLSICIIMEGFDLVLLSSLFAYPPFQKKFGEQQPDGSYQLTAAWQSGLNNGALCGQVLGLFVAGIVADRIGYRKTLMGALTGCIGFIFIIFFSESLVQLLIGQIFMGIPWGVFQTMTTTYASEVCPIHLRAYLTTFVNLCWVLGQFIASGVLRGMITRDDKWGYKIPFALQWIWPVPLIIGIYLAPESPWWLVRKGRIDEAKESLRRLTTRNSDVPFRPDETISMMIHTNEMEKEAQAGTSYADLFKGVSLRRTEIVCVTWMIQTLCGATFMGYSTYFYQQAGMAVENSFSMSLGQYAIGAVGTICSWFLMGWFGRRTLYLYGQLTMCLFLLCIGCVSFAGRDNVAAQWAIGSLLLVYTFTYDSTVGPVCYSLVAELTSTRLRTKSVVFARNMYNIIGIITNIITPRMLNPSAWNWGAKAGFFWAGTCFCCAIWTYFRLPEPKGRTYAEIDILFEDRVSARKFKSTVVEKLDADVVDSASDKEKKGGAIMVERVGSGQAV
ncbi:raffinose family of oligosaccharides transporter [Dactylonectria macrodidyma]|uniref:Raffinose family of oligosaccharides transporter n=1 Tax=Dactylonectria macrodidyma TaxID=307937 RepID=A0A9P9FFM6_9HYPO|nr:raffinose family of oligosaccharides transporter [Dactylonectria macrodidyma]